jgi:hypothetical protein
MSPKPITDAGWIEMFDGKSLDGWEAPVNPQLWTVQEETIVGRQFGVIDDEWQVSLLFFTRELVRDFEFKADIKLNHGGISSMYFRAQFVDGFAPAYIAQANNTADNPQRTGSLYNFAPVFDQLVPDDTWWTQHVIAEGNHIRIRVNDNEVVNFTDSQNTHTEGYLALLYYLPHTVVQFRNLRMQKLDWSIDR